MKIPLCIATGLFGISSLVPADVLLPPPAAYSSDAVITGTAGTNYWIYEEITPGVLTFTNNPAQLNSVLGGHAGAPGGNVELFANSEGATFVDPSAGGAFATATPIVLSGTAGGTGFEFRSLNGNDWFNTYVGGIYDTSYGADNLANEWFAAFMDSVGDKMSPFAKMLLDANRAGFFDAWRDEGGFASLSDANIGYAYRDTSSDELNFGLEGFIDASPRFRDWVATANGGAYAGFAGFIPDGIQYSEVVLLDGEAYYSFEGTPSGVAFDDPFVSYTANFAFTAAPAVPEPSALIMAGLVTVSACLRRRRK